jgi:hypothetical protein
VTLIEGGLMLQYDMLRPHGDIDDGAIKRQLRIRSLEWYGIGHTWHHIGHLQSWNYVNKQNCQVLCVLLCVFYSFSCTHTSISLTGSGSIHGKSYKNNITEEGLWNTNNSNKCKKLKLS